MLLSIQKKPLFYFSITESTTTANQLIAYIYILIRPAHAEAASLPQPSHHFLPSDRNDSLSFADISR